MRSPLRPSPPLHRYFPYLVYTVYVPCEISFESLSHLFVTLPSPLFLRVVSRRVVPYFPSPCLLSFVIISNYFPRPLGD
ncbi:hypothetical protein PUN28_012435 [Cardiocondyla obscurior]|uniref:Uncharacterized protein n=1 Tax=Cardiocondyla obscurior TaxID=286306 RepID=A0AAW2FEV6_9HYME